MCTNVTCDQTNSMSMSHVFSVHPRAAIFLCAMFDESHLCDIIELCRCVRNTLSACPLTSKRVCASLSCCVFCAIEMLFDCRSMVNYFFSHKPVADIDEIVKTLCWMRCTISGTRVILRSYRRIGAVCGAVSYFCVWNV
jgi:hypothetical protein